MNGAAGRRPRVYWAAPARSSAPPLAGRLPHAPLFEARARRGGPSPAWARGSELRGAARTPRPPYFSGPGALEPPSFMLTPGPWLSAAHGCTGNFTCTHWQA